MASARLNSRPRDMILSLAVVLVPILLISWLFTTRTETPVRPVEWQPIAQQARAEAPYPVVAPRNLPQGWVPVRATWQAKDRLWVNGWLTPGKVYVQVAQRDATPTALLPQVTREMRRDGDATVGGTAWERYRSEDDRTRALARVDGGVTTLVSGDLPYEDLAAFASTLG